MKLRGAGNVSELNGVCSTCGCHWELNLHPAWRRQRASIAFYAILVIILYNLLDCAWVLRAQFFMHPFFTFEIWKRFEIWNSPSPQKIFSPSQNHRQEFCCNEGLFILLPQHKEYFGRALSDPLGDATLPKCCSRLSVLRVAEGWKLRLSQVLRLSPGDGLAISSWFWTFKTVSHPHWSLHALSFPCRLCQGNNNY